MWASFFGVDVGVVHYMNAGRLWYFAAVRAAVLLVMLLVLGRVRRSDDPSEEGVWTAELVTASAPAIGIALLCVEFRGLASPYVPGVCLVLLARTIYAPDPWKRGLVRSGIPIAAFFVVLLGSVLVWPDVAAQARDTKAMATFLLYGSYVLGTYLFLVAGGHFVWSLRRQVFEARSLGRYRLKRLLATGGMGEIWVAYHSALKRDVAVKILRPDRQERSGAAARFEREARATAELRHPNTIRVYDYGVTEDGLWYYVMELLDGETLAEHVARMGALPPARAVHIVGQAARALGEAHERGIVHRDVKPENLFLTSLGGEHDFLKVLDFGIAKLDHVGGTTTETGLVAGTPAYLSPEVAMGQPADARSDVYALGAVLYHLLCGKPPFEAENAAALFFAHVHEAVVAPSATLGRALPPDLEAIVLRALEKDPAKRYANAADFALALAACRLAGQWTFGHATETARTSSRPPPPGLVAGVGVR
jgi:serine/threonine-protein kinase